MPGLGLTVADVAQNVRIAYDGEVVTSIRYGDEDVDFRVHLADEARKDLSYLENLKIPNDRGRLIRLGEVASLVTGPGPNAYRHYDGERAIAVTGDIDQEITTPLEVRDAVFRNFDLDEDWPGMKIVVGGEAEESEQAVINLSTTFLIALPGDLLPACPPVRFLFASHFCDCCHPVWFYRCDSGSRTPC